MTPQTQWQFTTPEREVGRPPSYARRQVKINAISFAHLVRLMMDGKYTCQELADKTSLHLVTVYQYTRELHLKGAAYITEWRPDVNGRHNIKVFKLGQGVDRPRLKLTDRERQRRYRERKRALSQ